MFLVFGCCFIRICFSFGVDGVINMRMSVRENGRGDVSHMNESVNTQKHNLYDVILCYFVFVFCE
eukprot:GABW01000496.1.p1 GENE.GABW01000496.1~~GABW01000496.1.p1  ORF type:complete len:65 (-),score=2.26 GABW01000496.1:21-215(-)